VNYNLNAATVVALGTQDNPSFRLRRTATPISFCRILVQLQRFAAKLTASSPRFRHDDILYFAKAWLSTGDDAARLLHQQRRNYARNDFDRTQPSCRALSTSCRLERASAWSLLDCRRRCRWLRLSSFLTLRPAFRFYFNAPGMHFSPGQHPNAHLVSPVKILHVSPHHSLVHRRELRCSARLPSVMSAELLSGPGFFNLDAALSKSVRFTERSI